MPLDAKIIKDGIARLQDPANMPTSIDQAADIWANFIVNYSSAGRVSTLAPTFSGYPAALKSAFTTSMTAKTFLDDIGTHLQLMWVSATWLDPSGAFIIAAPAIAIGAPLKPILVAAGVAIKAGGDAPTLISTAIDAWTKTITAIPINVATGVPVPAVPVI